MDEPTRLFSRVFFGLNSSWSDVSSFRRISRANLDDTRRRLFEDHAGWFETFVNDPANDPVFLNKAKFLEEVGGVAGAARSLVERELSAAVGSIDAASLVFMHSSLDAATHDLCRVTSLVAPDQWERFVEEQQERLGAIRAKGYQAIALERIATHVEALSHESLLKKTDRLFQVCKPDRTHARAGYTFERDLLERLDRLRHDIIHREWLRTPIPDIASALDFLHQTGLFLFGMVNQRYGVRIDSEYLKE